MEKKSSHPKIISVSRRTDIPAFYGEWFLDALKKGYASYKNPFNRKECRVSLKTEDVICFVFWSKNFIKFENVLEELKDRGCFFYFNYTINNYPSFFESNLPETALLIENFKSLSRKFSSLSLIWRYDPIIISDKTGIDFHLKNFKFLSGSFAGYTKRCITSFVTLYKKSIKNLKKGENNGYYKIVESEKEEKKELLLKMAEIAENSGISLNICSSEEYSSEKVKKASCIDANLIYELFFKEKLTDFGLKLKPTRAGCLCCDSIDIGEYATCRHNCIYCYAGR